MKGKFSWHDILVALLRALAIAVLTLLGDVQLRGAPTDLVRALLGAPQPALGSELLHKPSELFWSNPGIRNWRVRERRLV